MTGYRNPLNKPEIRRPLLAGILLAFWLLLLALPGADYCRAESKYSTLNLRKGITLPDQPRQKAAERSGPAAGNRKIKRLQEGIIEHKVKILNTQLKERSVLSELEKIDLTLLNKRQNLKNLKQQTMAQEELLKDQEQDLKVIIGEKELLKDHIKKRLAAYYRTGPVSLLNVIFSSATLPDLLTFQEYFRSLLQYDKNTILSYLGKINELRQAKREHQTEKERLLALSARIEQERLELADTRQAKKKLLTRINTEKSLYQQASAEIEKAAHELADTLRKIEEKAIGEPNPAPPEVSAGESTRPAAGSFAAAKGLLKPPVTGTVVTGFGSNQRNNFGILINSKGIDLKTRPGSEIRAVFPGRVITAGYMRGYGNMLIIDHGAQYYTVTSRAAEFFKKEGDGVKAGEVLGIAGEAENLHFEIRHGSKSEDPLPWLDRKKLQ